MLYLLEQLLLMKFVLWFKLWLHQYLLLLLFYTYYKYITSFKFQSSLFTWAIVAYYWIVFKSWSHALLIFHRPISDCLVSISTYHHCEDLFLAMWSLWLHKFNSFFKRFDMTQKKQCEDVTTFNLLTLMLEIIGLKFYIIDKEIALIRIIQTSALPHCE